MSALRLATPQECDEIVNALTSLQEPLPLCRQAMEELGERADILDVQRGEIVISQGDPPDYLYLVLSGQLRAADTSGDQPRLLNYHSPNAFVGEYGMVHSAPRTATVDALSDARLACWNREDFDWLLSLDARLRPYFETVYEQRVTRAEHPFPGKQWDEVVVYRGRQHPLHLVNTSLGPFLLLLAAVCVAVVLSWLEVPFVLLEIVAGVPAAIGLAWGAFGYFDWKNDEYIVTSKRVIHIERLLLYGEEWDEAPLVRIQDVTVVAPSWPQRTLDYSDVIVKTAGAGTIVLAGLREAEQVRETIFREQARARERQTADDKSSIRIALAQKMGKQILAAALPAQAPLEGSPAPNGPEQRRRLPGMFEYLYPRLTTIEGDTIAWRKHWIILVRKIAPPILTMIAALVAALLIMGLDTQGTSLMVVPGGALIVALVWYFARYDDWHRDVYIVTDSRIIDVESSAFRLRGESRREGTFDAVQNVTYSIPNFGCRLLNLGDVVIETAGTERTFTFNSVFNPSGVQQEVFSRWDAYHERRRRVEREREAQRLAEWIGEYHEMQGQTH